MQLSFSAQLRPIINLAHGSLSLSSLFHVFCSLNFCVLSLPMSFRFPKFPQFFLQFLMLENQKLNLFSIQKCNWRSFQGIKMFPAIFHHLRLSLLAQKEVLSYLLHFGK